MSFLLLQASPSTLGRTSLWAAVHSIPLAMEGEILPFSDLHPAS
jgi:hypothetical protein